MLYRSPFRRVSPRLLLFVGGVLLATPLAAEEVVVTRNVNLRRDPSTTNPPIRLLIPPDKVELLEPEKTNEFYHVKTDGDEEGWVWSRNVRRLAEDESPTSGPAALSTPTPPPGLATSIDTAWSKTPPNHSQFTSHGETCGATGDGGDEETNLRKNRTDTPTEYHDVAFDAIATLAYPTAPKHRHDWSAAQLAQIEPFEGVALRVVGYLVAIKVQTGGSGESTNCHWRKPNEVDWHVALVKKPGKGEEEAVVIETTPRVRRKHPSGPRDDWTPGWTPMLLFASTAS